MLAEGGIFIIANVYRVGRMVGAVRFELTTSCTRNKRASQATLRPDSKQEKMPGGETFCNLILPFLGSALGPRFFETCAKRPPLDEPSF